MNIIFGVIIGLNVMNGVALLLFAILKIKILRYLSHFTWIVSMIVIIIFFLVGALFGLVGTLGMDLGQALNYLFSATNINTIFSDPSTGGMLNICINDNGDIATKYLNLGSGTSVGLVSDLYTASQNIQMLQANISATTNSLTIPVIDANYDKMIKDFTQSSTDNSGPASAAVAWRGYSDSTQNKAMAGCSSNPAKDIWLSDKNYCPTGFPYITAGSSGVGSQSCLVVQEWSASVRIFNRSKSLQGIHRMVVVVVMHNSLTALMQIISTMLLSVVTSIQIQIYLQI